MIIPFVDLRRQYKSIKKEIDSAVGKILKQSNFILGTEVEQFEAQFADYIGAKYAVGVGSGTGALHLALLALGVGKGDEVIVPANTYIADALAVEYARAMFKLCDVDDDTYLLNAEVAKKKINIDTKAIIFVHLYGQACDIECFGGENNIKIVEDCAQSVGCIYKGQQTGSKHTGCFSFYPAKNLGCMGDGGAVTTNDNGVYTELLKLRNYGSLVKYRHDIVGYNCRLDTLQAAVLSVKLKHLDRWNEQRRLNAVEYADSLTDCEEVTLPKVKTSHVWHLYVIRVARRRRDDLVNYLRSYGIGVQFHYLIPIHKQECFKGRQLGDFPVTERLSEEILSLPMFPELTKKEIRYVCAKIKEFFAKKGGI